MTERFINAAISSFPSYAATSVGWGMAVYNARGNIKDNVGMRSRIAAVDIVHPMTMAAMELLIDQLHYAVDDMILQDRNTSLPRRRSRSKYA